MDVVHFHRRPQPTQFSLEGYFERVREALGQTMGIRVHVQPCFSQGVWGRIRNILSTRLHQGDINHVTGDIHYVTLLLPPRRTILTVHDCQILERLSGWRFNLVRLLWYTLPARQSAIITVNSAETKRQLLQHVDFPADRIVVIPVSVSSTYQPSPKVFNEDCPRILQIGTKANKNVLRLADALRGVNCSLDIVGPVDQLLRNRLQENGICFRQFERLTDEQLLDRYREADIVSFVSTHEGFGMPIVEAQCVERVCVTSNCSSMPEVAGDGACFVDPLNVQSIRAGFERVIRNADFRNELIDNGRRNRMRFQADEIARSFAAVYERVANSF